MDSYLVYFYQSPSGRQIVKEFIEKQDILTQTHIQKAVNLLKRYGLRLLNTPILKKINRHPSIFELRITLKKQVRLLFFKCDENAFMVCLIFVKKTQKIPRKEFKIALKRAKEYV